MDSAPISAVDGFVLAMLGMMFLSGGVIVLLIICGLRNSARRNHEVDQLIEEMNQAPETEKIPPSKDNADAPKPEPWERSGDWWRK